MNKQEADILKVLYDKGYINQRQLAYDSRYSVGIVNKSLKSLQFSGYISSECILTTKAYKEFEDKKIKNAIILAAGYGMRMVTINMETPKALLEINGEPLIERIIKQLHEVDVQKIYVIVGFMKESFEYLIDEYDVELVCNDMYSSKNNLHSLNLVADKLSNTYVIPSDIWFESNPFAKFELYSWYMVNDIVGDESSVRINRKMELIRINDEQAGNEMVGVACLLEEQSRIVEKKLKEYDVKRKYNDSFWEEALYEDNKMILMAKVVLSSEVAEINTYEQLRDIDENSVQLKTQATSIIQDVLNVSLSDINNITVLKKGMTNRSFLFTCKNKKYIMRIPGEGTDSLINRKEEAEVYKQIKNKNICDDIIYINPDNGYKITEYYENARVCNSKCESDLFECMSKLREMHNMNLKVNHEFNIFEQIDFYEKLWNGNKSVYKDYEDTKRNVFLLKKYIEKNIKNKCLTHIDAVPDNFLFVTENNGETHIKLIDWEYAGMQDPHVDIAMFCIYSFYNRAEIDRLIDIYFENNCDERTRIKIYCYISVCGLLWSNWCEYKRSLGVEFGEYSIKQYRYAKEFYRIAKDCIEKLEN